MEKVIKEYIRDERNNPRGVCVAVRDNDEVFYGFSLCSPEDKYDKNLGITKALARAKADSYQLPDVQERKEKVLKSFENLEARALKYFKDLPYSKVSLFNGLRQ